VKFQDETKKNPFSSSQGMGNTPKVTIMEITKKEGKMRACAMVFCIGKGWCTRDLR
jgi:hypothetical protein